MKRAWTVHFKSGGEPFSFLVTGQTISYRGHDSVETMVMTDVESKLLQDEADRRGVEVEMFSPRRHVKPTNFADMEFPHPTCPSCFWIDISLGDVARCGRKTWHPDVVESLGGTLRGDSAWRACPEFEE